MFNNISRGMYCLYTPFSLSNTYYVSFILYNCLTRCNTARCSPIFDNRLGVAEIRCSLNSTLRSLYLKDLALIAFQCRLTDQTGVCDACQRSPTTLGCFGFRLEHLVDQMLECEELTMTRIHRISELTVGTEVSVNFHGFCVGKFHQSLAMSPSRLVRARNPHL